jgi:hypothetical protein
VLPIVARRSDPELSKLISAPAAQLSSGDDRARALCAGVQGDRLVGSVEAVATPAPEVAAVAASQLVRTTLARFPDNERSLWLEVDIAIARGDLGAAERRTRELLAAATDDYARLDRAHRTLATLNLMRGRVRAAEAELHALEPVLRRDGTAVDLVTLAGWEGFVSATARHAGGEAATVMDRVLDGVRLDTVPVADRRDGLRGYVYALAGQPRRARALAAEGRAARRTAGWRRSGPRRIPR